jgi:hypothetical protein
MDEIALHSNRIGKTPKYYSIYGRFCPFFEDTDHSFFRTNHIKKKEIKMRQIFIVVTIGFLKF